VKKLSVFNVKLVHFEEISESNIFTKVHDFVKLKFLNKTYGILLAITTRVAVVKICFGLLNSFKFYSQKRGSEQYQREEKK